ncbi:thiolase family protein [Endozoicomonas sp. Mp262]|uniref:thiolase family protein n=1 Tax=Endozoicomonas sp. Mp262 TaxID=2919499 RepID=UPI0021DF88C1
MSRGEQDQFALVSQQRAALAIETGGFKNEIVPVSVKSRKITITIDTDEHPRPDSNLEKMASLRPAFKKDGTVTAANASGINDGAAALLLASGSAVKQYGLEPVAEIVGYGQGGVDPSMMGMGPVPAIGNALKKADMQLSDMDLLELNEAFAAQSLGVINELCGQYKISPETLTGKTNVNGGAIALGHPIGASGARILVTLTHELRQRKGSYGLAALCIGGGMGAAIIIRRC